MAPKTGASLSCHASIPVLFSIPRVTFWRSMCKPCTTRIRIHVIAVRAAFDVVMRRSNRHTSARSIPVEIDAEVPRTSCSAQ